MVRCPNCGQETEGDSCQWCHYPILKGKPARQRKSYPIIFGRPFKRPRSEGAPPREAEEARKANRLAKEQARKEAEEAKKAKKLEKERAKRADELKKASLEAAPAEIENEQGPEAEKTEAPAEEAAPQLYEGVTELIFPAPVNIDQLRKVEEQLKKSKEIKLLWSGGSEERAAIAVSTPRPMPLIDILQQMSEVSMAAKGEKEKKITVTLKAP